MMTPVEVAKAHAARIVREQSTPVYTSETVTVDRGHRVTVEMEYDTGYRTWSAPMWESSVNDYVESFGSLAMLSDVDHGNECPCGSEGWPQED